MLPLRRTSLTPLLALALLVPVLHGCDEDDPASPGERLSASWMATSFVALGNDFIDQGMSLTITLNEGGTYTFAVTNDLIGSCSEGTSCTNTGTWEATSSELTLDEGTEDEITFDYTVQGSTLTLMGAIDENPVTITFTRQ